MAVRCGLPTVLLLSVAVLSSAGIGSSSTSFTLERSTPASPRSHDMARHARILGSSSSPGSINYGLDGGSETGLYYTKIHLGSPPQELKVVVDTGSDVLWVSCSSTGLRNSSRSFHLESSETSSPVNCSHPICIAGRTSLDSYCSDKDDCIFSLSYGDGSFTSGHFVSDLLHTERTQEADSVTTASAVPVVFGCSTRTELTTRLFWYADGIMGLGHNSLSLVSQLATQGIAPRAISHCLRRHGGGTLTFGAAVVSNMVYTRLVPSKYFYTVNLQSVYIDGQRLPVDSSVFETSGDRGTFLDSGTTHAYLVQEAYDPFLRALNDAISRPIDRLMLGDDHCYSIDPSVGIDGIFPQIRLEFEGLATLVLEPKDYIQKKPSADGTGVNDAWCLCFHRTLAPGMSILGEMVLMNKMVAYDLEGGRIGWADSNCSSPVNVSMVDTGNTDIRPAAGSTSVRIIAHPRAVLCWIVVVVWSFVA